MKAANSAAEDHQSVISGLTPTDEQDYFINGKPLEDGTYYSIAAPDALIYGDPSYAALADESFDTADIDSRTVSEVICSALRVPADPPCVGISKEPAPATLTGLVSPEGEGPKDYALSVFAPHHHDPLQNLTDKAELRAQLRPLFFAKLQKNNVSYGLSRAHPNDSAAASQFGGVTDPRVVKVHNETLSVDHNLRVGLAWDRYTAGIEDTLQFGRNRQGSTSGGADSVALTNNQVVIGPFFDMMIRRNAPPYWRLVARPGDYSSNLARTFSTITGAKDSAGKPTSFIVDLPARRSLSSKAGLRYEAPQRKDSLLTSEGNSFFEFGYKSTWNLNVPTAIILNPGTPTQTTCSLLTAKPSLSTCAKGVAGTVPRAVLGKFDTNQQNGVYWTTLYRFPITKVITYKVGTDGEFRPVNENSAETRYAITFDNYFQTRIWGNFGLAPHFGWFFYENQIDHHALIRHSMDISLTYSFDCHQGMTWRCFLMRLETKP